MNEQQLADLFSEQIDRMLDNETLDTLPDIDDLQELITLGNQISNTQFQVGSVLQAAFHSQLAGWFGLPHGGSPMAILGLSKVWFISITVAVVIGFGALVMVVVNIFGGEEIAVVPTVAATVTGEVAETPPVEGTLTPETSTTPDPAETPTGEETPETEPTDEAPTDDAPTDESPTLIFVGGGLGGVTLCQGSYGTQATLVNYGDLPVTDAALVWDVIEGAEFIDNVNILSPILLTGDSASVVADSDTVTLPDGEAVAVDVADVADAPFPDSYAFFNDPVSVKQDVKLDVKIKVKDNWWQQENGTKIKVKLSVKNKVKFDGGNQEYKLDYKYQYKGGSGNKVKLDYKVKYKGEYTDPSPSQIVTIVKQDAEWITLSGVAQPYGDQSWLVDGVVVATNECTGLPLNLVPGAYVDVIGFLQPDGTFVAINIIVVNVDVTVINFDSGVPMPNSDGDSGGGGSKKGGSKKGGS